MTSGKSWLGKDLALASGFDFIDIDDLFEERYRITILDFFQKYGESLFRSLEREMLRETGRLENAIVATGGGAPCFFDNMDFILKTGTSFYLRMAVPELMKRIKVIKKKRPLLTEVDSARLETYVTDKLREREPYYLRANYILNGPDYPIEEILKVMRS